MAWLVGAVSVIGPAVVAALAGIVSLRRRRREPIGDEAPRDTLPDGPARND